MSYGETHTADLSLNDDATILALWKLKFDTYQIATKLKRPEWQIANRLRILREETRQRKGA
jgi:hypothetical protein